MATSAAELMLRITADNRESINRQINEAVATALDRAMAERGRGILVTRHASAAFSVGLSDDVPFGLTREHREWKSRTPATGRRRSGRLGMSVPEPACILPSFLHAVVLFVCCAGVRG